MKKYLLFIIFNCMPKYYLFYFMTFSKTTSEKKSKLFYNKLKKQNIMSMFHKRFGDYFHYSTNMLYKQWWMIFI